MFIQKNARYYLRRPFQIYIGLVEGYGDNKSHTKEDVLNLIGQWMKQRAGQNLPVLTGGLLLGAGDMIYLWNSAPTGIVVNTEKTLLFVGEVNPLYNEELSDSTVKTALSSLASFLGEELKQTRMYLCYREEMWILEEKNTAHPTEKK